MATIDSTGFTPDTYSDLWDAYIALLQAAFGNINTDPESVIGHNTNLWSLSIAELNELAEDIISAQNPQAASKSSLSALVLLNGIQRQEAEYSTVSLTCTANAGGCTIPAGSLVSDGAGNQFATDAELILAPSASDSVSATAVEIGAVTAAASTLTTIDSPVTGWASVTNAAAATEGQSEESDATLRARRQAVSERASTVSTSALYQAISDVTAVEKVRVEENYGVVTDSDGVPRNHVWCIVYGGNGADVVQAIFEHTSAGRGTHGGLSLLHTDATTGVSKTIYFDRPTDIDIYVTVNLTTDTDYPAGGDADIEAAIEAHIEALDMGDDVVYSRFYTPVNATTGHQIDSLYIGTSPSPSGTANISMSKDHRPVAATITVNS